MPKAKIVLSYRRSDARAMAGRIRDKLAARYGDGSVYIDIDNIPFGTDFRKHIDAALGQEDIVVAIIGPKWRGDESGSQPRIFDETDPVRVEIETALRRGLTIVPILIDGASMPDPSTLPDSIRDLSFINAAEVDEGRDFHQHMDRVARSIDIVLQRKTPGVASALIKRSLAWATVIAVGVGVAFFAAQLYPKLVGKPASPATQQEVQTVNSKAPATTAPAAATSRPVPAAAQAAAEVPAKPAAPATRPPQPDGLRRVALVVGNSAYQHVPKLRLPANDASAIAKMLVGAGFEVILQNDVRNIEFKRAIRRFGDALTGADIAVVFYAGHGIEVRGTNYLISVDARLASDRDAEDEAVSLDRLVQEVEDSGGRPKKLRLIMLDACRDNPFIRTMRTRGLGGLSAIQPTGSDMLIAYSSKAGTNCADGDGEHSVFTQALLRSLTVPGLDIRLAFGRVRDDVLKSTGNRQEPFVFGSLGGGVVSLGPASDQVQRSDESTVKSDYDRISKIGTRKAFEVFLGTHKTGFYADLARAQVEELKKLEQKN